MQRNTSTEELGASAEDESMTTAKIQMMLDANAVALVEWTKLLDEHQKAPTAGDPIEKKAKHTILRKRLKASIQALSNEFNKNTSDDVTVAVKSDTQGTSNIKGGKMDVEESGK